MTRSRSAILLAALALIGVQRLPCLLGAVAQGLRGAAVVAAPCHAALSPSLPSPSLPSAPDRESGSSSPCSRCVEVHALVVAGSAGVDLASRPATPLFAAALLASAASPRAASGLHPLPRGRAPDRARAPTVRLL